MSQLIDPSLASQFDRLPPHNIEAEQCLIASLMLEADLIGDTAALISRESFYQADHQIIYDVLLRMYEARTPCDVILLRDELIKRSLYEEVGGKDYLATLLSSVPSAAHGQHYAKIVADRYKLRLLISASNDALRDAYTARAPVDETIARAEERIFAIAEQRIAADLHHAGPGAMAAYEAFESTEPTGLETGYFELDDMLCGLQKTDTIIIAARPSIGKTALAMNIVEHACLEKKVPTAVFSLEMGEISLMQRLICSVAEVDSQRARHRALRPTDFQSMAQAVQHINGAPLYIDESATQTVLDLRAKCRRLKKKHGLGLVIVDYLQLMSGRGESREQEVSTISRGIKCLAREVDCPVILVSQLNRNNEGREGHRPKLSDLRSSGAIEQDADVVILLHREDYYNQAQPDFIPDHIAEAIVAKQRKGPTGVVKLAFDNRVTKFRNLAAAQIDAI